MKQLFKAILILGVGFVSSGILLGQSPAAPPAIEGIWEAKHYAEPNPAGTLDIIDKNGKWNAQIAQFNVAVTVQGDRVTFELPGAHGRFAGRFVAAHSSIRGHWSQAAGNFYSPVVLAALGRNDWRGEVVPLADEWTMYLVITRNADGSLGAFIRNPDRNRGFFWSLNRAELDGNRIKLIGKFLNRGEDRVFGEGNVYPNDDLLSIYFPERSTTYDFRRVKDDSSPGFYALAKNQYEYHPPIPYDDGWKVGTLDEAGIAKEPLNELLRVINSPPASVHDLDLHSLLIARHGKLVFEEYFHGFNRTKPHDLRSAAKSVAATIVGAVMQSGGNLSESTHVYNLLYRGKIPGDFDPRKKEMTVRHLLTMSSGFDCNDWADSQRPGSEDTLEEQRDAGLRDYYDFTLRLPMDSSPGAKPAYCSVTANLLGAVLKAATNRPVQELFQDLVAEPLQMHRYYLGPQPSGEPYLAGGMYLLPRDYMKFAQLMLNGGVWNGKRILSAEFAARAGSPLVKIEGQYPGMRYGYLWWTVEYPYHGRTIHAYFASGNGGQEAVAIPELDLVVLATGGNYNDRAGWSMVREYIPKFILAAVKDEPRR
ncbi:MAG TPA: serine hydrolase [Pyrinomonadaceae bacterium]|nr:serine hydrolase [Pyrinomonadaceae bacterium]